MFRFLWVTLLCCLFWPAGIVADELPRVDGWELNPGISLPGLEYGIYRKEDQRAHVCRVELERREMFVGTAAEPADYEVLLRKSGAVALIGGGFTAFHKKRWHTLGVARGTGEAAPRLARRWPLIYRDSARRWRISSSSKLAARPTHSDVLQSRPRLLYDGGISRNTRNPDVTRAIRHPRALVGLSGQTAWLVVIEGRFPDALGLTLLETAEFLKQLGIRDALNLDGGGSAVLVLEGHPVSRTSGGLSPFVLPGSVRPLLNYIGVK